MFPKAAFEDFLFCFVFWLLSGDGESWTGGGKCSYRKNCLFAYRYFVLRVKVCTCGVGDGCFCVFPGAQEPGLCYVTETQSMLGTGANPLHDTKSALTTRRTSPFHRQSSVLFCTSVFFMATTTNQCRPRCTYYHYYLNALFLNILGGCTNQAIRPPIKYGCGSGPSRIPTPSSSDGARCVVYGIRRPGTHCACTTVRAGSSRKARSFSVIICPTI